MVSIAPAPKSARPKRKKATPKPTPEKWVRDLTSWFGHGLEVWCKKEQKLKPVQANKNDLILYAYSEGRYRELDRLTNADFRAHWSGEITLFFTASHLTSAPEVLIKIDVDCHDYGSAEGSLAFCEHLADTIFPGLYHEGGRKATSRGRHAYLRIGRNGLGNGYLRKLLCERLLPMLREIAKGFDVSDVEVKGLPFVLEYYDEQKNRVGKSKVKRITAGSLAKVPRDVSRFEEWTATTLIDWDFLHRLPVVRKPRKEKTSKLRPAVSSPASPAADVVAGGDDMTSRAPRQKSGSTSGLPVDLDHLRQHMAAYAQYGDRLLAGEIVRAGGRHVVTAEDVGIFCYLTEVFTNSLNADKTMPRDRYGKVWQGLYRTGAVPRGYDHARWKAVRDFLSDLGLIHWLDKTYKVSTVIGMDGRGKNGTACKWWAADKLMRELAEVRGERGGGTLGSTSTPDTDSTSPEHVVTLAAEEQEGGGALGSTYQFPVFSPSEETTRPEPIRPVQVYDDDADRVLAQKIDHYLATTPPTWEIAA